MSFRKIRPSFGESSASASNPSQSTSESTGSDLRRNRAESFLKDGEGSQSSSKRRRVPESVTRNACLSCKKARAKCDGNQPCKRCASRVETSECVYEVHIKHAKEELVRQIKDLKLRNHMTEQILHALSTDEKVPEILECLKRGETYQSIVEWLGRTPPEDGSPLSPRGSQYSTAETTVDQDMGGTYGSGFRWTYVTAHTAVLDHLFQLYFAWVHPVHTLFSEGHFVDSYQKQLDHFCSETLVNAICAMACHLHSPAEGEDVDFQQLGLEFSAAVRSNIDPEDCRITTTQAFAVLFLVDCAQGKGLRASSYLTVACNNLAHIKPLKTDGFLQVWRDTVRGIRNLNIEWAQMTFRVPATVDLAGLNDVEEITDGRLDDAKWYFYRYVNDQCPAWPGLLATTNREKSKLVLIIEEMLTIMYAQQRQRRSALEILRLYRRLVAWRADLPTEIGDVENNASQALPHVLSLLVLYENTVVQLLRPLLDLEGFPSSLVEEVAWSHGQYGLFLLDEHYRTQYTCRYQPVLQMFAVLHISDMISRFFPIAVEGVEGTCKDGAQTIHFGLECLMQSHIGFPVAGPMQEMLRRTAVECAVHLPQNLAELMTHSQSPKQMYQLDDLMDAYTRPTYAQPAAEIHKMYSPSFIIDWASAAAEFGFQEPDPGARRLRITSAEERGAQSLMQIRNLLNSH